MKTRIIRICLFIIAFIIALQSISFVLAEDPFRPDLHGEEVPSSLDLGLRGKFDVDLWQGASTYAYPIEVLPGTNGLQPTISLYYNSLLSADRPGLVGTAWIITENAIVRDVQNSFANTADDTFRLVLEGKAYDLVYSTSDARYHTEIESFLNIQNLSGGNNTYSQYWIVRKKDGTAYRFGYSNTSELTSNLHAYTTRWSLDLVTDIHGNNIYYTYLENPYANDSAAVYPSKIEYNTDRKRTVDFILESSDRLDKQLVYEHGNKVRESRRLKEIQIRFDGNLTRRYVLNYTSLDTPRSFLSSILLIGKDNSTALPPTKFNYQSPTQGWDVDKTYLLPTDWLLEFEYSGVDNGVRLVDLNRDGLVDIAQSRNSFITQSWISNGSGWILNNNWVVPEDFVNFAGFDLGTRIADINGDGLIDLVRADGSTRSSRLNSVIGWLSDNSAWHIPANASFVNRSAGINETGTRLVDINGDGRSDILSATDDWNYAWINNGSGWVLNNNWTVPASARFVVYPSGKDEGVRIVDVNGDNLPDLVKGNSTAAITWINNGSNWEIDGNWSLPTGVRFVGVSEKDTGVRFADLNGDSLEDILQGKDGGQKQSWINNGTGWSRSTAWDIPDSAHFVSNQGSNKIVRIADLNGDGLADLMNGGNAISKSFINKATKGYLLRNITNAFGGITFINYRSSTSLNNSGNDSYGDLGFNLWLTGYAETNNNMSGVHRLISPQYFMYSGGMYDYPARDFRGFNMVDEIYPNSSIRRHWFHQSAYLRGREYRIEMYGNNSDIFTANEKNWSSSLNTSATVLLTSERNLIYDARSDSPVNTSLTYSYDAYGNIIAINHSGNTGSLGDEKSESFEYVYNITGWIMKPKRYALYDSNNTKLRETFYRYDNLSYGSVPLKGDLTWEERWTNTTNNSIQKFSYDTYGNVIAVRDGNDRTASYIYGLRDATYTFADQMINAKNHTFNYRYSMVLGKLLSETDGNGYATNYTYDVFARPESTYRPYDYNGLPFSGDVPTVKYTYTFDGTAPEMVKVRYQRQTHVINGFEVRYFYDGMGNLIQKKSSGSFDQQRTFDYYYDSQQRIIQESNPYFSLENDDIYATPNQSVGFIRYSYDPLSRITETINPDNTRKNSTYNRNTRTEYDENGNKKLYTLDAYGRITTVTEYNGNNYFLTTYSYNSAGDLLQVNDAHGRNVTNYAYDTVGRKIRESHIDSGTWQYTYDAAGNVLNQTNAQGVTTQFTYDELNRVTQKRTPQTTTNYTYDRINGTLSMVVGSSVTYNYTVYDQRLRKTSETVFIDGKKFTRGFEYDSMDKVISEINPDGAKTRYFFDADNLLAYLWNEVGGNTYTIGGPQAETYTATNQPTKLVYGEGDEINVTYTYTSNSSRVSRISIGNIKNLSYAYDRVGNVIQINDSYNNHSDLASYDNLHRLIASRRTLLNGSSTIFGLNYTYGLLGDILTIQGTKNVSYFYNSNNAPRKIMTQNGTIPLDTNKYYINTSGTPAAWFGNKGNIVLKGKCSVQASCNTTDGKSFIVANATDSTVAYINSTGDLCIEKGNCSAYAATCNPSRTAFIIQNSTGTNMSYIDFSGGLCYTGNLYENSNFV